MPVSDSILDSTKKALGIDPEYTAFDAEITMHINTVFFTLQQIGVGPSEGYMIEDNSTTWTSYLGDNKNLNAVKTYVYLRVRILFDPPATSFALDSMNKMITELEWRLNVEVENIANVVTSTDSEGIVWEGNLGIDPATGNVWGKD